MKADGMKRKNEAQSAPSNECGPHGDANVLGPFRGLAGLVCIAGQRGYLLSRRRQATRMVCKVVYYVVMANNLQHGQRWKKRPLFGRKLRQV
jgi:hypothetical protein